MDHGRIVAHGTPASIVYALGGRPTVTFTDGNVDLDGLRVVAGVEGVERHGARGPGLRHRPAARVRRRSSHGRGRRPTRPAGASPHPRRPLCHPHPGDPAMTAVAAPAVTSAPSPYRQPRSHDGATRCRRAAPARPGTDGSRRSHRLSTDHGARPRRRLRPDAGPRVRRRRARRPLSRWLHRRRARLDGTCHDPSASRHTPRVGRAAPVPVGRRRSRRIVATEILVGVVLGTIAAGVVLVPGAASTVSPHPRTSSASSRGTWPGWRASSRSGWRSAHSCRPAAPQRPRQPRVRPDVPARRWRAASGRHDVPDADHLRCSPAQPCHRRASAAWLGATDDPTPSGGPCWWLV